MNSKNKTLLIDCGNTYLKWSFFDGEELTPQQSELHKETSELEAYKELIEAQCEYCDSVLIVSVLGEIFSAGAKLISEEAGLSFDEVISVKNLAGITNAYEKIEKLGSDRLVGMVAAHSLIDDSQACIVIDSGTATTIDAVDVSGQHMGGVIFPGLELSLNSLSRNTELLPQLSVDDGQIERNGFAKDTNQAITTGCLLSLASAIDGICNKMERELQSSSLKGSEQSNQQPSQQGIKVSRIICGGAATALLPYLEHDYEHCENLLMLGLKKIKEISVNNA